MLKACGLRWMLVCATIATSMVWLPNRLFSQRTSPSHKPVSVAPSSQRAKSALPGISFADVTRAAGIDFRLTCGGPQKLYIMDSMCGGVAAFDYDNDGWVDIFLENGSEIGDYRAGRCHFAKLYH